MHFQRAIFFLALATAPLAASPTHTDHFAIAQLDSAVGYIALEPYLKWSNPGHEDALWMPTEADVANADRNLRAYVHQQIETPGKGFPVEPVTPQDINDVRGKFTATEKNFDIYSRQYAGAIIKGHKVIICHYSLHPTLDPGIGYIELGTDSNETFDCRYDPATQKFSNVEFGRVK